MAKDIAPPVASFGSPIADRIASWLRDNPEAEEYCLNTEIECSALLLTIAATVKMMMADMPKDQAKEARVIRNAMCRAAAQNNAMEYIRNMNETDPIEFLGVMITVPERVIQ